jgi:hypothetical protein
MPDINPEDLISLAEAARSLGSRLSRHMTVYTLERYMQTLGISTCPHPEDLRVRSAIRKDDVELILKHIQEQQ